MYRRIAFIISVMCAACTFNTAGAVTWTAGEIVQAMQQAIANGQPFDKLLAEKVRDELAKSGFQVVDNQLTYATTVPAMRIALDDVAIDGFTNSKKQFVDYLKALAIVGPSFGACALPIPEGSLVAARSDNGNVSAKFSNTGTYLNLQTTPSQVILTLNVDADITASTRFGFEWCGAVAWPYSCSQLVRNPGCPPPVYACDVCWKRPCKICPPRPEPCNCGTRYPPCGLPDVCAVPIPDPRIVQESWTDWANAGLLGPIKGSVALTIDHSFTVASSTITVGASAKLSPVNATAVPTVLLGPVIPDLRLISVPVPPFAVPHVDKSQIVPILINSATLPIGGVPTTSLLLMAKAVGYDETYVNEKIFPDLVRTQQARLDTVFNQYFPLTLQLPTITDLNNLDPASRALLKLVLDYLYKNIDVLGEFVLDVVKNNWTQVLYYVLTDNRAALAQLFAVQAVCPSVEKLKANMATGPLYSTANGTCTAVDPRNPGSGPFFAASSCATEIGFQRENFAAFCHESFTPKPNPLLGNAAAWPTSNVEIDVLSTLPSVSSKWTLSSTAQLAVGVEPISKNSIPFVKRINFRQAGSCALEMRVYKKNIVATNLTPLLWVHGGAWTYRSSGFLGMESLVSNYTEDNFVVFAPFYRLAGDKDGSAECRNATWQDMVADVEAALDWVKANGASLGADTSNKIAVTGQSAGAHLAGWLMTHRANEVSRGLLVYPPTDLNDFLTRLQGVNGASFPPLSDSANTPYDPRTGQENVETYLQLPKGSARTVDLNNPQPYLSENSFAQKIAANAAAYPPAFILHGTRDSLLTYSQSQVLCQAYGGVVNVDWLATPDLRAIFPCGSRSGQLHLFKEADHVFEVCPFTNIAGACRAGSAASASLLVDSIQKGRRWLINRTLTPIPVMSISASAYDTGNLPAYTDDNNFGTRWTVIGRGQWIQYDLGAARNVGALAIAWDRGDARIARFDIQTSADGATWRTVYSGLASGVSLDFENVVIPPSVARFVRIVGNGNNLNQRTGIVEVQIFSSTPPRNLMPIQVSASASEGTFVPQNTIDNNLSTRWQADGNGQWIQYDLGAYRYFATVGIAWYRGDARRATFDIQVSQDGLAWTTVRTATSNGATTKEELYEFATVGARYVRIVGHGNNLNTRNSITEVNIYGTE